MVTSQTWEPPSYGKSFCDQDGRPQFLQDRRASPGQWRDAGVRQRLGDLRARFGPAPSSGDSGTCQAARTYKFRLQTDC